jgi:hypothetical protein
MDRPVISEQSFEGKRIEGPAVIAPWECIFEGCVWSTDFDTTFWPITDDRPRVAGAIELERCTFTNCVFIGVGIAAPESDRMKYKAFWA